MPCVRPKLKTMERTQLPELIDHHMRKSARSDSPPDIIDGSPPGDHLLDNGSTLWTRQVSTLDSRHTSRPHRNENPYYTPPRGLTQRGSTYHDSLSRGGAISRYETPIDFSTRYPYDSTSNLLYSSLTRRMAMVSMDTSGGETPTLATPGPPPDMVPQPPRRITGTATPPDITASPNNTWQAML